MLVNKINNSVFNFRVPSGKPDNSTNEVLFPVPEININVDLTANVPVKQMITHLDLGELSANKTLNIDIDSQVTAGAILHVKVKSNSTARSLTLGTGITAPVLTGVAKKTKVQSFIYVGTEFLPLGASLQID